MIAMLDILVIPLPVHASSEELGEELEQELTELKEEISFDEIEKALNASSLKGSYSFTNIVESFVKGEWEEGAKQIGQVFYNCFLDELSLNRKNIIQIILIAILSALFTNLATGFLSSSLQETGFFVVYPVSYTHLTLPTTTRV